LFTFVLPVKSQFEQKIKIKIQYIFIPSFAKPFRFDEMWLFDRGCLDIVEAVWLSRGEEEEHDHVMRKIDKCGKELCKWE